MEVLVALVIGVLLVALTPPLLSGMSGATELRGAARQLAAGLRNARNEAVTRQQEAALLLDLAGRRFAVSGDAREVALPNSVELHLYTAQSEVLDREKGISASSRTAVPPAARSRSAARSWLTGSMSIGSPALSLSSNRRRDRNGDSIPHPG
jgi:general secretion pathway protein H